MQADGLYRPASGTPNNWVCGVCISVYSYNVGGLTGLAEVLFASWLHSPHLCLHPPTVTATPPAPFAHLKPTHVYP